jgi:hypothetical protein
MSNYRDHQQGIAIAAEGSPGRFFIQDLSNNELPPELQGLQFHTIISTEVIERLLKKTCCLARQISGMST